MTTFIMPDSDVQIKHFDENLPSAVRVSAPPGSDTGVQRTKGTRALVDWLSFTLHGDWTVDKVCSLLGLTDWIELDHGFMGYRRARQSGSVRVLHDGTPEMGVHVIMSGSACREMEQLGLIRDWSAYLRDLIALGASITRLDIAFDDFDGLLSLDEVVSYWERGWVVTRWRGLTDINARGPAGGKDPGGRTLQIGSRSSATYLRIYDKAKEQKVDGHWVRVELEMKKERAQAAAEAIARDGLSYIVGVLRYYIDFVEPTGEDSNKRRWRSVDWWARFLDHAKKLRLAFGRVERTIEKLHAWLRRQVAPSLAAVLLAFGGDFAVISELLSDGRSRLSALQWLMIKQALAQAT